MSNEGNGAWHCHGCIWSAFDLISGREKAAAQASQHTGLGCEAYRCEARHAS